MPFSGGPSASRRILFLATVALIAVSVRGLGALPKGDDIDGDAPALCEPRADISFALRQNALPLVGTEVDIIATSAKITLVTPDAEAPASCVTVLHALRPSDFEWELVAAPSASTAALAGTSTLTARLRLDAEGTFRVRFTACPDGCELPVTGGAAFPVAAESRDLLIEAVDEINLPPDTEPVRVPPAGPGFDGEPGCQAAADLINPAWVTVGRWRGPQDYRLLEGRVVKASVSRTDNNLNHHTNDINAFVKPDIGYAALYAPGKPEMEVEWETGSYPEAMRPTRGDRMSAWGYWINDCAHGARTEIHPPVLTAVHRARAIRLPASFGTNVFVPGIVTDVWASRDGGEATGDCSLTGLHQPGGGSGFDFGPHTCLPHTEGFTGSQPNPLRRDAPYTFTIYLPRDPRDIAAAAGHDAPEVPLTFRVERRNGEPAGDGLVTVTRVELETGTALAVSVDLSGLEGPDFYRRIVAGWAYAAPDNWGLRRWKLRVGSLDVQDDGDGRLRGDGDWRFWFNTTSVSREWSKLFDCDGCVHGREDFGGVPWETDAGNPPRDLGRDLLLFPGQQVFVNATGYEKDWNWEDSTGQVTRLHPQLARAYQARSYCRRAGQSGCASYTLNYEVVEGPPLGPADLSAAAQRLYDAYSIGAGGEDIPGRVTRDWNLPEELALETGQDPAPLDLADYYVVQEAEPTSLGDIGVPEFRAALERARAASPERLDLFLAELRDEVDEGLAEGPFPDVLADVAVLRDALPTDLWDSHFADVDLDVAAPPSYLWLLAIVLALIVGFVLGKRRP